MVDFLLVLEWDSPLDRLYNNIPRLELALHHLDTFPGLYSFPCSTYVYLKYLKVTIKLLYLASSMFYFGYVLRFNVVLNLSKLNDETKQTRNSQNDLKSTKCVKQTRANNIPPSVST